MFTSLVAVVFPIAAAIIYLTRFLGHRISVTNFGFFYVHGLSYMTPTLTIDIGKFDFKLKLPSRADPAWAIITILDYEYKDSACHVSMDSCLTKLWFFPVLFRSSFGPWVDATIEGFVMRVYDSRNTPSLLRETRRHLVASTLNGETVRLGWVGTRFFFGRDAEVPVACALSEGDGENRDEGLVPQEKSSPSKNPENGRAKTTTNERDDIRVRITLEQWQMVSLNHRMYTFGEIQGELRRSWLDDRGSVVVIMKDVAWVRLPYTDAPLAKEAGILWEIARAVWYFPSNLFTLARDPVAFVNVHVGRFDVTFCNFRLRDAELLKQGAVRLKQEHLKLERRHPGLLSDFAWDMFVHGVQSMCKE